ncbi:hypothetical protein [Winogradskyella aurantia]|uniref:Uncharacterized protein n=1 Tax=Winogradskyella aurantia TaxID=1915063 RepID=A0A265URY2_9FLAO|nr:hypothetical protein [Winogradskyella aurantia]OZV68068.1 hypothetical protein CA834_10500 [Winogradskyella aurantia]
MDLRKSLILAIIISSLSLILWECYWRTKPEYYTAYLEDDRNLWSEQRAKVDHLTSDDVILIGASRTGYNFNTHIWEEIQGVKPIHLSANGKPPGPFLEDIVNNTDFNGTIVMGIVPLMVFRSPNHPRSVTARQWVAHYYNRTYAQKLGFALSKPLQRHLVMLSSSELKSYNNLDLKSLINTISFTENRVEDNEFKLVNIGYNDEDRNLIMFPRLTENPFYQKEITDVWNSFLPNLPDYSEDTEKIAFESIDHLHQLIKKFKARGGRLVLVRHKVEAEWYVHSSRAMPREKVWDKFVDIVDCPNYHFEDYEFMSKHTLPEWSHMNAQDAKTYTQDFVNKLIQDKHLTKKIN